MYVLARSANKLIAALASAAMAVSLCPVSAAFAQDATELSGAPAAMHEALDGAVVLEADAVTTAKSLINALPDAPKITAAAAGTYDAQIAEATAAYDALPEADQKALDAETCLTSNQPYGRVLECAQWALKAMRGVDASTTLGAGTYSASTTPALSSEYSKGKSTSARQRPWSIKDVTVVDGKAYGTVTVQSDTYTYIYMAGQKFENTAGKNQHSTFENVPIDLNSTQYLTAYSTSMQTEIVFSITTTIDESATGGGTGGSTGGGETPGGGSGEGGGGSTGGGTENPGGGSGSGGQETVTPAQVTKLIAALPSDPYKITIADVCQIHDTQVAYESLTDEQRSQVDVIPLPSGVSCQRALEVAVWAVQSLAITDNTTTLADGVYYLKQGDMKSDMGISVTHRNFYWSVMKIVVSNGKATATLKRSGGNTPIASVYFEGRVLDANQDGTFTIPIALNTDMYFATKPRVDSTTDSTVGLIYHLNTTFDVANAKPDATIEEDANGGGGNTGGSGDNNSNSESTGATTGPVNTTGNVGTVGNGNALGLTSGSNNKKASAKAAAADSDSGAAATSANAASGARSGSAAGDAGTDADTATIPPLAVGGSFAGVALAGGAGFFALFRKREQH